MKIKKLLGALSLAIVTAIGGFALISNIDFSKSEEVKAESWIQNPTVYFVPCNNWVQNGGERFKMNYYDNGTYKGNVEMTLEGTGAAKGLFYGRKVYKGVVTDGTYVSRVQILRMSPEYTQWNYSGQIYLTDGNASPVLMMDADFSTYDNWTTSSSGVWFNAEQDYSVYKTSDYSPSSSTGRVFFNNSGTHWADNSGNYKGCAVYAWGGDASPRKWTSGSATYSATVYHLTWFNDDNGMSYGYADIPLNASGYKFVRTTVADEYTTGLGYFSDNQFNIDSFAYVRFGNVSGNEISSGGAKDDVAGANLMKKVVQAYDTCSSSVLNGYGAYNALNTNFYLHATAAAKSATEKSLNGQTKTIQAHFEGMQARSTGGTPSSRIILGETAEKAGTYALVIIVGIIGVSAIGSYFFLRRRKEN